MVSRNMGWVSSTTYLPTLTAMQTQMWRTRNLIWYTLFLVYHHKKTTTISFFICITGQNNFWFKMVPGFHILYNAHFSTHCQCCSTTVLDGNINISAYTPKHLFHNFAKIYQRLTCDADDSSSSECSSDEAISEDQSSGDESSTGFDNNVHNELLAFVASPYRVWIRESRRSELFCSFEKIWGTVEILRIIDCICALLKEYEEQQRYWESLIVYIIL